MSHIYRDDDNAGCFGALGILAVLGIIVAYVGMYLLLFFLILGAAVGWIFSLIIYVRAFIDAVKQARASQSFASRIVLELLKACVTLFYNVTVNSIRETMTVVSNSFTKFLNHRVLSFQKWMWLAVVICVIGCEITFVIGIILLQAALIFFLVVLVFYALLFVGLIYLAASLCYTAVLAVRDIIDNIKRNQRINYFDFSAYASYRTLLDSFRRYICTQFDYIRDAYNQTVSRVSDLWNDSKFYGIISIRKWFYLTSFLTMGVVSVAFNAVVLLACAIMYAVLFIVNVLWTTVMTLINLIRR